MQVSVTYSYRSAQSSDVVACVRILRDWIEETPWMPMLWEQQSMETFWRGVFETDKVWIAESESRIVGFCVREDDNIGALYVRPEVRGHGVGKGLLDLAKEGRDWITVWAFEANEQARKFYHREGLVEIYRELDGEVKLMDVEHRWTRSTSKVR